MRIRVSAISAVVSFVGLGLPAVADTVSFSFSLSATSAIVTTSTSVSIPLPQNAVGTMPPFGPCQMAILSSGASLTFTLATGDSFTATNAQEANTGTTHTTLGTITGGTGIFTNATGTFQITETLGAATNLLVPYTYTGSGTITAPNVAGGVNVLPSSLQLQTPQGGAPTSTLILQNQGLQALSFTASTTVTSGPTWLSVSAASGAIPPGAPASLQVTADTSGLALGVYQGQVDMNVGGVSVVVPVTLIVGNQGGDLQLSETGEAFMAAFGGSPPAAQKLQVQNTGVGNLTGLTATTKVTGSGPNWLQASIAPGFASQTAAQVTVSVNPGSLPPGTYYGQVNFNLPSAFNSPQSMTVQMVVQPGPPPTFTPAEVEFQISSTQLIGPPTSVTYGAVPPAQTVRIDNPGSTALAFTAALNAASASAAGVWLALTPSEGVVPAGGSAALTLSVPPACFTDTTNSCYGTVFLSAGAVIVVNFPSINYSYNLRTFLFTNETTVTNLMYYRPAKAGTAILAPASSAGCTGLILRGVFTSLPLNFQTAVGQPTPLEAAISDECGNPLTSGSAVATFSSGDPSFPLTSQGSGLWTGTWTPRTAGTNVTITLVGAASSGASGALTLPGSVTASTSTPIIGYGGIVNAASYSPVLAPGAFISIYGVNFGAGGTANTTPFPNSLASAEVFLAGQPLPLYFTSSQQIDAIVPYDIAPGSTQQVVVQSGDALSQPANVTIATAQPGVFTQDQSGSGPGAILGQKPGGIPALNTAANPASAGDALLIFCTGLGTTNPAVAAGAAAPTDSLSYSTNTVTATVGGQNAQVLFSGLAPGYVGLYQVNLIVPSGVTAGPSVPVVLTEPGTTSATVTAAIH